MEETAFPKMNVPLIAISLEDDATENTEYVANGYLTLAEALTDIESLDSDVEPSSPHTTRKRKSPLVFKGVGGDGIILTDSEYIDGSGDDDDDYRPRSPTPLDNVIDLGGTFEDILQVNSEMTSRGADMSKVTSKSTGHGFLGLPDDHREGLTDYEDFALSDDDWIEEDMQLKDINLDDHIPDDGVVDIADSMKHRSTEVSPAATPEPGAMRREDAADRLPTKAKQGKAKQHANRKAAQAKKKTKSQFLSPRPEVPLDDLTDTEVLKSDSDDDRRGQRATRRRKRNQSRTTGGGVTDIEDLDMSDYEGPAITDVDHIPGLPKVTQSAVLITRRRLAPYMGPDTDAEDMNLSDREDASPLPTRQVRYRAKTTSSGLSVPVVKTGAVTDVEDLSAEESSEEESAPRPASPLAKPLEEMEAHYGSVTVSYSTKDRVKDAGYLESDHGVTDHEDFTADDVEDPLLASKRKRAVMKHSKKKNRQLSSDEEDVEGSDGDFRRGDRGDDDRIAQDVFEIKFMEVDGEARPILVAPGGKAAKEGSSKPSVFLQVVPADGGALTDVEEVGHSSASSDSDDEPRTTMLMAPRRRRGSVTDVEDFEDEVDEKSSVESGDETDHKLPEAVRELTLVHYQHDGRPVVVTLPLDDNHPVGLLAMRDDATHAVTDVEDLTSDEQDPLVDEENRPSSPEIEMDFGIIDASEAMKVEKKLRVLSVSHAPLTDTEDLYFDGEPTRRKKTKKPRNLFVKQAERSGTTDVEELEVSDAEAFAAHGIAVVRRPLISLTPADGRRNDKTDVEDVSADDDDDEDDDPGPKTRRSMSVTPDIMKNMDYSMTTFKEGDGPFPREMRRLSLDHSQIIPTIRMTSPTPTPGHQQTDSEDMQTSADDEPPSRADSVIPFALDDSSSTVVLVKHTRKLDYDAPEEAVNIKGYERIREAHTDVEEVSEDERQGVDRVSVEESSDSVCVCVTGVPVVCVCVGKKRGDLSMVWKDGNATAAATAAQNVTQGRGRQPRIECPSQRTTPVELRPVEVLSDVAVGRKEDDSCRKKPVVRISPVPLPVGRIPLEKRLVSEQSCLTQDIYPLDRPPGRKLNISKQSGVEVLSKKLTSPKRLWQKVAKTTSLKMHRQNERRKRTSFKHLSFNISVIKCLTSYITTMNISTLKLYGQCFVSFHLEFPASIDLQHTVHSERSCFELGDVKMSPPDSVLSPATKHRTKIQTRAWTSNIILNHDETLRHDGFFFSSPFVRGRWGSVSKLISKYERLRSVSGTLLDDDISSRSDLTSEYKSSYTDLTDLRSEKLAEKENLVSLSSNCDNIRFIDSDSETKIADFVECGVFQAKHVRCDDDEIDTFDQFEMICETTGKSSTPPVQSLDVSKPIVNIVSLKDRSISPKRLQPSSVQKLAAFKMFCEQCKNNSCHQDHKKSIDWQENAQILQRSRSLRDRARVFETVLFGIAKNGTETNTRRTLRGVRRSESSGYPLQRDSRREWTGKSDSAKDSAQSGSDDRTQGAAGGVTVTTTETRVVEGSGDMQDLLEKLAAESRK